MSKQYNPQDVVVLVNSKPIKCFELDSGAWDEVTNALKSVLKTAEEKGVVERGSWDEDQLKESEQESNKENNV